MSVSIQRLGRFCDEYDCQSAVYAELAGLKSGVLLSAAEKAGFEALITTDQEIPHQQNLRLRSTLPSPNLIQKRM